MPVAEGHTRAEGRAAHAAPAREAPAPRAAARPHAAAPRVPAPAGPRRSPLRRALRALSTALAVAAVVLAAALVGVRLVGLDVYAVLSGSMEPAYHVGSVVYVRDVDPADLGPGDVITFMLDEDTVATHRVVEVVPDGEDPSVLRFRTKGDANDAADGGLVHCSNVIGTPVFTVPYLGYVAGYVQGPPGCWAALAACALLAMLAFLPDLFAKDEDGEEAAAPPREGERGAADAASAGSRAVPRRAQAAPACAKAASPGRSASHARPGGMHSR